MVYHEDNRERLEAVAGSIVTEAVEAGLANAEIPEPPHLELVPVAPQ